LCICLHIGVGGRVPNVNCLDEILPGFNLQGFAIDDPPAITINWDMMTL
jgi:hypothetical protein